VLFFCFRDRVAYLWYNLIGCAGCALFSVILQALPGGRDQPGEPKAL
jgi:hypothetical protein